MGKLDGSVALVTGSSRGIGAAIARCFVSEGAAVVLADVLDEEGRALASELGEKASFQHLDVAKPDDWASAVKTAQEVFGPLKVLVNNAGVCYRCPIEHETLEQYMEMVNVNQIGCFLGMKVAMPAIRTAGGGSIVNTSSIAGLHGLAGRVGYVASKFAVRGMSQVAALEFGQFNIRVNSIYPGPFDTAMSFDGITYDDRPLPRRGRPDELANLALFLASDDSSFCTGAEFVIDGGKLAGFYPPKWEDFRR